METTGYSAASRNKILTYPWDLHSRNFVIPVSFEWKNNDIRIETRSFRILYDCITCVHLAFYINAEFTLYKYYFDDSGEKGQDIPPELLSGDFRITFHLSPSMLEVYEEKIAGEENAGKGKPTDDARKDVWIPVDEYGRSVARFEKPVIDPCIRMWIKKSFSVVQSRNGLLFEYNLYTCRLFSVSMQHGNFTCHKIYNARITPRGGIAYEVVICEIADPIGICQRKILLKPESEERGVFSVLAFLSSLGNYMDWRDYDRFKKLCERSGVSISEVDRSVSKELNNLKLKSRT